MDTPRPNDLYRQIAKDYKPKAAEMNICKYIRAVEDGFNALFEECDARIARLESRIAELEKGIPTVEEKPKTAKKGAKANG